MKLKVAFYFPGGVEVSHETEGEDSTQLISNIQKHRYYNMVVDNTHHVVDTEKAVYFSVTELDEK
ncbi:hypothetical protein [Peribacillus glennii]|uniref:Uncharacterized protein n=1 Tax=Peribacillus glennii TaxID=2303991 RepID=A0A372LGD6_9BACI|nr:hypothetical protein [Peribacillus glennii]RFU65361.1 hypothetical protein D0466_05565 [Peribacillus glennii]